MSWKNCFDHDVDFCEEDGCPVCKCCEEIKALKSRITDLEVALSRIHGHTSYDVAPGTPAPDIRWIWAIAEAALHPRH